MDLERLGENQSLKLITSCESSRSKTLPERCVGPTHLSPKMSKVGNGSSEVKLFLGGGVGSRTNYAPTARLTSHVSVTVLEGCLAAASFFESSPSSTIQTR